MLNDNKNRMNRQLTEADKVFFEKQFAENRVIFYSKAMKLCKNPELAEDVLQEAYVKAWSNFRDFDQNKKFMNWFLTIIKNAAIDAMRNPKIVTRDISFESLVSKHNTYQHMDIGANVIDDSINLQDALEKKELYNECVQMLNVLPQDYKDVLLLSTQGHSYEEIADMKDISLGTVRARIHRAKKILQNKYSHLM